MDKLSGVDTSERVQEWELGLPNVDDITPLSHALLSSKLLSAFNITPEPYRTSGDVTQASEKTMSSLRGSNFNKSGEIEVIADEFDDGDVDDLSEAKKPRRNVSPEDADSAAANTASETAVKPARLVWTPQLHKRFVDVVAHLGIKNSVPKTIMQLMNVEGLTRENVASHLQKYRLYLKRNEITPTISPPAKAAVAAESSGHAAVPVPMIGNYNHQNYQQNYQQNNHNHNNYNYNQNYQFSNGVMQTGNNNMYGGGGGGGGSYHHNQFNHNYHSHVAPGEK